MVSSEINCHGRIAEAQVAAREILLESSSINNNATQITSD
jgi:hypothetical protein